MFFFRSTIIRKMLCLVLLLVWFVAGTFAQQQVEQTRVIITTDGEIDDECSMVRCLLYANDFDIEGIITTSSQYHWQGHQVGRR